MSTTKYDLDLTPPPPVRHFGRFSLIGQHTMVAASRRPGATVRFLARMVTWRRWGIAIVKFDR